MCPPAMASPSWTFRPWALGAHPVTLERMGGTLWLVATPIGNLGDLSTRAREVLGQVDLVACEDTRRTGRLLAGIKVKVPLVSYFEGNERERVDELLVRLGDGDDVALVTDGILEAANAAGDMFGTAGVGAATEPATGELPVVGALRGERRADGAAGDGRAGAFERRSEANRQGDHHERGIGLTKQQLEVRDVGGERERAAEIDRAAVPPAVVAHDSVGLVETPGQLQQPGRAVHRAVHQDDQGRASLAGLLGPDGER